MRVRVDTDRCIGSGMCVLSAPDIFDQGEADGVVRLLDTQPRPERQEAAREAAARCPAAVISVDDDG
jgi:ferredoxin